MAANTAAPAVHLLPQRKIDALDLARTPIAQAIVAQYPVLRAKVQLRKQAQGGPNDLPNTTSRIANVEAVIAHMRGQISDVACLNCQYGHGLFSDCISIGLVEVDGVKVPTFDYACTNCHFNDEGHYCSFHRDTMGKIQEPTGITRLPAAMRRRYVEDMRDGRLATIFLNAHTGDGQSGHFVALRDPAEIYAIYVQHVVDAAQGHPTTNVISTLHPRCTRLDWIVADERGGNLDDYFENMRGLSVLDKEAQAVLAIEDEQSNVIQDRTAAIALLRKHEYYVGLRADGKVDLEVAMKDFYDDLFRDRIAKLSGIPVDLLSRSYEIDEFFE